MSPIWQPPASGGGGAVATDVIWDTKGDLAAATGADAAVKVAAGADGLLLVADSASTAGVKWGSALISHTELQSAITLTGTSSGSSNTIITAAAFTPNGTDAYLFEWSCAQGVLGATSVMGISLWDNGSIVSTLAIVVAPTGSFNDSLIGKHRYVPTNASHTFTLRGYSTSGAGVLQGGDGTAGGYDPIFLRITRDV